MTKTKTFKPAAAMPQRSTASAVIGWGMLTIPISLYSATESTGVTRKEFTADGHEVGRAPYDKVTGDKLDASQVVRKVDVGGEWVELTNEEIAVVTQPTNVADIIALVNVTDIGSDFRVDGYYQARPSTDKKVGPAAVKPFALLTSALARRGQAALLRMSIRGSAARFAALLPDGQLVTLHYADGVREARPMPTADASDAEMALADQLLDVIAEQPLPEMIDTTAAEVMTYAMSKATGTVTAPAQTAQAPNIDDLFAKLSASVDAAKAVKA